ncbi:MAG: hydroxymethylglutaryl-CoA lyase, partial [Paracoccaceae bacterium]
MADAVTLFEVGPRDGLQNEPRSIPAKDKIHLVNELSACGFQKIEVTSFVSPKWVPQMADATEVLSTIDRRAGVSYAA